MRSLTFVLALLFPAINLFCEERPLEFNRDIRPILSDKCYLCHGPDATAKKIALRLDREAIAKSDLGGHRAIAEGDPASSELVRRITAEKTAIRMPPVYSGLKLTEREIETLRTWIAQGAKWQKHWSFIPPVTPALPAVKNPAWIKNSIDAFVLERLDREGLSPSTEAARETLLRRVSLDLTGLPPTLPEMDSFLNDKSANAYERAVDRLLASPRYGERMAARWLDAARYADSNGYQYDGERYMWRWRDWVIEAFNRNQPFDRFTLEQLAGDMLPNATTAQKIATGFNRNHRANTEDGIIPEEYAVEYVVDRVETTSAVFMGATLGCARCHNHKYDPFTQKEFYQIFAYFNNIPEMGRAMKYGNSPPVVSAPTRDQQAALKQLEDRIQTAEKYFDRNAAAISAAQNVWEKSIAKADAVYWTPAEGLEIAFPFETGAGAVPIEPGRIGKAARFDGKDFVDAGKVAAFDIEDQFSISAWFYSDSTPDGSLVSRMVDGPHGKGYGVHLNNGRVHVNITDNWADDAIRLETEQSLQPKRWYNIAVTYTGSRMAEGISVYVDGKPAKVKVELDTLYRPFSNAGKTFVQPLRIGTGWGADRRFHGLIDDVRVYRRVLHQDEISSLALGEPLNAIAQKPDSTRTPLAQFELRSSFLENSAPADVQDAFKRLSALRRQKTELQATFPTVMVMAERPVRKDTFLLVRGAYNAPGEKVPPGVPAILPPLPAGASNDRLGFAKWLIDPGNPLLARVTVNRFWQMYFGTGLVKTTEDFGMQGEWPSHPELLDWLATRFIQSGWDTKAIQKLIVTSATYRQSSKVNPELVQRDPDNRLLARGARNRLPAEMVRDQALLISGLLAEKIGGPSVKPYQPAGLWQETSMQDMDYNQGKGEDLHRRSLYTFWKRTIAPPMMANFDAALRESCVVRETRTNTPLQALNLMNDVTFLEASRFLGQRMIKEGGQDAAPRLQFGFRAVTGRTPSASEQQVLRDNLQYHLDYFAGKKDEASAFLKQGETQTDSALNARELAAYSAVASLLLNLDETVTKE